MNFLELTEACRLVFVHQLSAVTLWVIEHSVSLPKNLTQCCQVQMMFGSGAKVAVQDPSYPAYVDSSVMIGQTGGYSETGYDGIEYMVCRPENDFFPDLSQVTFAHYSGLGLRPSRQHCQLHHEEGARLDRLCDTLCTGSMTKKGAHSLRAAGSCLGCKRLSLG